METFSSSFLQKHTPIPSLIPSSAPLLVLQFKISSVKTDEKQDRFAYQIPKIKTFSFKKLTSLPLLRTPSIPPQEQKTKQIVKYKKQSLVASIFNFLDEIICSFIDPPLHPSIDPKHVLSGNFSPVNELPPTDCTIIEGSLPLDLNGAYIRNGPNPQFKPNGPYHLFDGDGMLHSITISKGKAKFCCRFVKTYKYKVEQETGSPVLLNVFSAFNSLPASIARCAVTFGRIMAGQYDSRLGIGNANTSLALFSGKLFALGESDLPYAIKQTSCGDILTLGREECFGKPFMTMTAHPKTDPETGETFAFRHSITLPFLSYFKINAQGVKQPEIPIHSVKQSSLMHDFAITENYAIFPDTQIVIKPLGILKGKSPVRVDHDKIARLGIIPRYAENENEMWWVEVPGLNIIHAVNAWEEDGGDTIVVVASNALPVEHALERLDLVHSLLERIEINMSARTVTKRPLSGANLEFAVMNQSFVGKKNRYVYAAIGDPLPKIAGVVKLDLTQDSGDCVVASRLYGPGCYGGEPWFVPNESGNRAAKEDDGYLVTYIHNENTGESKFLVMDAKSPNLEIIAAVKLPQRVPYGFHGIFVPEYHLQRL